jgi:hypothetical protein
MEEIIVHGLDIAQKSRVEDLLSRAGVPASDINIHTTGTMKGLFTLKLAIRSSDAQVIDVLLRLRSDASPTYPCLSPQKFMKAMEDLFEFQFMKAMDDLLEESQ